MSKEQIDSILLTNNYLIKCKYERPNCPKTELVRKYLNQKIKKALFDKKRRISIKSLIFSFFALFSFN
jgi:hypothetical protein